MTDKSRAVTDSSTYGDKGDTASGGLGTGRHVLYDALLPVMTLRESALDHNIATLQRFTERHGLLLAPHMKTHMAPALAQRQLDAGAWGVTVASVQQAVVAWESGIRRILIANEVLDPAGLAWIAARSGRSDGSELLVYVDSPKGVDALAEAVGAGASMTTPSTATASTTPAGATTAGTIDVLIEIGWPGGRTGARDTGTALDLAERLAATPGVRLRGTSGYEGGFKAVADARAYIVGLLEIHNALLDASLLEDASIVSLGGSAYFDVVAEELGRRRPGTIALLRSGAYLTHDDGVYLSKTPFDRIPGEGRLVAALEIWARVVSSPEPGLAIVAMGKRDAPYDEGLAKAKTIVTELRERSVTEGELDLFRMDDQHGYLRVREDSALAVGDVVRFGISHPCTAFDKWRVVLLVDDDDIVLEGIRTYF